MKIQHVTLATAAAALLSPLALSAPAGASPGGSPGTQCPSGTTLIFVVDEPADRNGDNAACQTPGGQVIDNNVASDQSRSSADPAPSR